MKVINDKKRLLFTLKEKTSGLLVVAPEELILVDESLKQTTPVDPRPYKVYTALLTQSGTNAPVATVLENTLGGDVVWSRHGVGVYSGTLSGVFTLEKTYVILGIPDNVSNAVGYFVTNLTSRPNSISLGTPEITTNVLSDGILYVTSIEIRVYN